MKIINVVVCIFLLSTICAAQQTAKDFDRAGSMFYSFKNYTGALDYFNKSLDKDPNNIDTLVRQGDTLKALKEYNASIDSYNKALKLNSSNVAALSGLTDSYIAFKDYTNALNTVTKANGLNPKIKTNWVKEGQLLQLQGRFEEASTSFERALALDKNYSDAFYRNGLSAMALGNNSQAMNLFNETLAIFPQSKTAYNAKGLALESEGKYADA